jgi:hypothetical protein
MHKAVEKVIKLLRKNGWQVDVVQNKHYKATIAKEGFKSTIVFSSSPSDKNAIRNIIKDFRNAVQAGGFDTLDNYRNYLITECEFDDILEAITERLTNIADAGGVYEEAIGHMEVLQQLCNVSQDDFFTDDAIAINDWMNFRKRRKT